MSELDISPIEWTHSTNSAISLVLRPATSWFFKVWWGVGGNRNIVPKPDPLVSNSAWEIIFQIKVVLHFTTWILGFFNISKYLARYGIQMHPLVTKRRQQSGKKPVLCMWGQLSTIIRGRERVDQYNSYDGKIAQVIWHCWTLITSTSVREVSRTSARRVGHSARAGFFLVLFSLPPSPRGRVRRVLEKIPGHF